jgi:signal transduction histidine kinase
MTAVQIDDLRKVPLFEHLNEFQFEWLATHSEEVCIPKGEYVYHEGDEANFFYVVMEGEIQVSQDMNGHEMVLALHKPGNFSGEVPLLSGTPYVASSRALVDTRLLRLDNQSFRDMFGVCPVIVSKLFSALSYRIQTTEALARQREKMSSLGVLSAGLAHELNNPAAAARRAASQLAESINQLRPLTARLCDALTDEQFDKLMALQVEAAARFIDAEPLDSLTQSDREDELNNWMDDNGVEDGWELAAPLVNAHISTDQLEDLRDTISEDALDPALRWLVLSLNIAGLLHEVEESTKRISDLVKAVKSYSYMDQAPSQEIDIHEGLEDTVKIMNYKVRKAKINLVREFDRSIPMIHAYGSELNQVWTNIIDNAIDAIGEGGTITLRTRRDGESIWVEICDNGPGIPQEVQSRIFDPFFTTKEVGKGTGLGLDIAHRIVVSRHHGELKVESVPGSTCFQIRLPIMQ